MTKNGFNLLICNISFSNFNHKDKTQKAMKSKIVYRLNCLDCEKFYVGQSIRHVCKRKEEHMGDQDSVIESIEATCYTILHEIKVDFC